jgi:hypothetical protein
VSQGEALILGKQEQKDVAEEKREDVSGCHLGRVFDLEERTPQVQVEMKQPVQSIPCEWLKLLTPRKIIKLTITRGNCSSPRTLTAASVVRPSLGDVS